jgi:hypothetical protein
MIPLPWQAIDGWNRARCSIQFDIASADACQGFATLLVPQGLSSVGHFLLTAACRQSPASGIQPSLAVSGGEPLAPMVGMMKNTRRYRSQPATQVGTAKSVKGPFNSGNIAKTNWFLLGIVAP